ncbi:MAG: T9SS type A sorting domain-containing protein [Limnohabitans sp.]|nr:T9SS type A sorting domain-containing protein [Limnohabitans sp.]
MKKTLLLLCLVFLQTAFALDNPRIGIILEHDLAYAGSTPCEFRFKIKIKNTGDVPLTNVKAINVSSLSVPQIIGTPIAFLQPGEVDETSYYANLSLSTAGYTEHFQIKASAVSPSNITIVDLSHYNDFFLNDYTSISGYTGHRSVSIQKNITYQDLNLNNIIDVGDAIKYNYIINYFAGGCAGFLYNSIDIRPQEPGVIFNIPWIYNVGYNNLLEGIHYLTTQDINSGYVYGTNSHFNFSLPPYDTPIYNSYSPNCSCTIPAGYDSAINLNGLRANQITGTVTYQDTAGNCNSGVQAYTPVSANNGTYDFRTFTNFSTGNYNIIIPNNGNYNTTINNSRYNNSHFLINPTNYSVTSSGANQIYPNKDFCISSADNYTDLEVSIFPKDGRPSRPGFPTTFKIVITNYGSTIVNGDVKLNFNPSLVSFASALTTPVVSSNDLTWNLSNFYPFQSKTFEVTFNVLTPPTVVSGTILPFQVNATTSTSGTPQSFQATLNQEVVNSYDPNDIRVLEGNQIALADVNKYIHYLVRFQNTGTAAATTVVVKQNLDSKLDWDTFTPVASSHTNLVQVQNKNDLTYTFSNINLINSSANEPASHGWLLYKIKPKSNVVAGDILHGTAKIYFDYNPPITTNTSNTEIVNQLSNENFSKDIRFVVYPNPTQDFINIEVDYNESFEVKIINQLGQLVKVVTINEAITKVDIKDFAKGIYFLTSDKTTLKNISFIKN